MLYRYYTCSQLRRVVRWYVFNITGSSVQPPPQPGYSDLSTNLPVDPSTHLSTDPSTDRSTDLSIADLIADVKVVGGLQDLESDFSNMMMDTKIDLADCNIEDIQFYLDDLFGVDEFRSCQNIDEVLRKLRHDRIDTFNIIYLERLVSRFHQGKAIIKTIKKYKEKKEEFLRATTVKEFQQAVVSRAETVLPRGMAAVTIKIPKEYGVPRTMKDVEELAKNAFKDHHKDLVRIHVTPGSIIITWYVHEGLCEELVQLARKNIAVFREEGVEEVTIVGEKSVTLFTQDGHEVIRIKILSCTCSNINSHCVFSFTTYRSTQILMVNQKLHYLPACAIYIRSYAAQ